MFDLSGSSVMDFSPLQLLRQAAIYVEAGKPSLEEFKIAGWENSRRTPTTPSSMSSASDYSSDPSDDEIEKKDFSDTDESPTSSKKRGFTGKIDWKIKTTSQPCPFHCGKSYSSTIGVRTHLGKFHLEEQKAKRWKMPIFVFECRYCPYRCNRRSNLERHLNRYHIEDHFEGQDEENDFLEKATEPALNSDDSGDDYEHPTRPSKRYRRTKRE